jgi:hypothetical protein
MTHQCGASWRGQWRCPKPATCYAGGPSAGDWADYFCDEHAAVLVQKEGWSIWDRYPNTVVCETCGTSVSVNDACYLMAEVCCPTCFQKNHC